MTVSSGFFIGVCLYINAFSDDFKSLFNKLNGKITLVCREKSKTQENNKNIRSILKEAVLLHNEMLKYSKIF